MSSPQTTRFESVRADMNAFSIHGMHPFSGSPTAMSLELMENAHGLLLTFEEAWRMSDDMGSSRQNLSQINPMIHAKAIEGISALIALALYLGRGGEA